MSVGWTGKLPAHGDFVTGGIYSSTLNGVKNWFDDGMKDIAHQVLDQDAFLTSPFSRLVVSKDYFGQEPAIVLVGPGMDSIGRLFPFAIVAASSAFRPYPDVMGADVFEKMEHAFLAALNPAVGQGALQHLEVDLKNYEVDQTEPEQSWAQSGENGVTVPCGGKPSRDCFWSLLNGLTKIDGDKM